MEMISIDHLLEKIIFIFTILPNNKINSIYCNSADNHCYAIFKQENITHVGIIPLIVQKVGHGILLIA